jgi:hypothetical protein
MSTTYKLLALLCACLLAAPLRAQQENTLYFMDAMPQATHYNPSKSLDHKLSISLPVLSGGYFMFANDGFSLRDAVKVDNRVATISMNDLAETLGDRNRIRMQGTTDWLGIYYRTDSFSVNFHVGERLFMHFDYPKELFDFFFRGNAHPDYFGKNVLIDPDFYFLHYREYALGGSKTFLGGKFRAGATLKYLQGLGYIEASTPSFQFLTSAESNYPITVSASGEIKTAGLSSVIDDSDAETYLSKPSGSGLAMDLGFTYQVSDKLQVEGAVLNIGGIKWKEDTKRYALAVANSTYTFSGIDVIDVFKNGQGDNAFDQIADSVSSVFEFENEGKGVATAAFRSGLHSQVQLGASYHLQERLQLSALFSTSFYEGNALPLLSVAAIKDFGHYATAAISYTATSRAPFNMGLGFSFNTPIQIHIVSDNLLSGLILPQAARYISVRMGVNMVFGSIHKGEGKKKRGEGASEAGQ